MPHQFPTWFASSLPTAFISISSRLRHELFNRIAPFRIWRRERACRDGHATSCDGKPKANMTGLHRKSVHRAKIPDSGPLRRQELAKESDNSQVQSPLLWQLLATTSLGCWMIRRRLALASSVAIALIVRAPRSAQEPSNSAQCTTYRGAEARQPRWTSCSVSSCLSSRPSSSLR